MMDAPHGQISALVSLIANAAKVIEAQYATSCKPVVPSLDDTTPHPFDSDVSPLALKTAIQTLEGACAQLCATVARPGDTILNKCMNIYEPACFEVVLTSNIPDILQETPCGMSILDLGKKTGIDPAKLGRILRYLATKHIFREVTPDVFANNRLSMELLSSNPLSSLAMHFADENNKSAATLTETLSDPDWGHSCAPEHTAFNKWSKYPASLFSWYEGATPEGAKQGARFGVGMLGWGKSVEASSVITGFPWESLGENATVCDVGGGIGTMTMQLAKAHSNLLLKLQDLPERIEQAQNEVWPQECPEAIRDQRIEFKAMNFLTESPIKGCDVYYLKNIIHDWPDNKVVDILRNVRGAMKPCSRVLIHEYVLQRADRVTEGDSPFEQAPEPLLPNYGVGRIRQYALDLDMMVMLNSQERRLEEFVALGEEAGLVFVKLWNFGEMSAAEFRLVRDE
ncbi:S-adenosyl-L-methionine-dependent methyltransferase [Collybia nuda]|uniref:S-adenosyl-L-methionine-dependent methyltransferase n=1 Tax=Collybia nuda TaxID=64659 RepID=A0A9P5Y092_9AGAR|nr:S-adenosyl-L-methionine-dependent methyltransferase [Collybia nuda]